MPRRHKARTFPTAPLSAALLAGIFIIAAVPARAGMGPCVPDDHEGLVCGSGDGAARVIDETLSPSKRFALAWRVKDGPIEEQPDDDKIEVMLIRLADGVALTKSPSGYWNTGTMRVNRFEEHAAWSPNSRLVVRTYHTRFSTDMVDVYALAPDGASAASLDLLKIMDKAVRAQLRQRVRDPDNYAFSLPLEALKVGNDGLVRSHVMMWVPKEGPERNYALTLQVVRKPDGALSARVVSIVPARARR